jgi:hypothetical protein
MAGATFPGYFARFFLFSATSLASLPAYSCPIFPSKPPFREGSSGAQEKSTLSCPEMLGCRAKISLSTHLQSIIYKLT